MDYTNEGPVDENVDITKVLIGYRHNVDEHDAEVERRAKAEIRRLRAASIPNAPIPMLLYCPKCHNRHIDEGEFATKAHHTHSCQHPGCGVTWRPAVVPTTGVEFLPNFKNGNDPPDEIETLRQLVARHRCICPSRYLASAICPLHGSQSPSSS